MTREGKINTAMVLAAGFGTRMRPITDTIPKPLVRLDGRALIDHALDRLADAGIARAVVNVHYLANQIEAHLHARRTPEITVSDERDAVLETGGGVAKALPLLGPQPFIVHNSDSVWSEGERSNIAALTAAWEPHRMDVLLLLAHRDRSLGYKERGDYTLGDDGRLARRPRDGEAAHVYAGVSILNPPLFDGIADRAFSLNRIFDKAMAEGRLFGVELDGTWMHVGTPEALADAERFLNDRRRRTA
ncbi:mannose-1-phosphate guanylyltransferase [Rhodomicrobium udaipurense JA643]|uniref:Nucleotidyltransferase family protein n=1 Tax=Rhodomicrobium udaipurense TaxID=1202716 RepID=A0A8I1GHZ6_9HYPH|nr:nucleotidyltransferase family protein [Rhodomicrobium udaipurense]KAI96377.1 mannose-1-phosphate guanylyltransferase [Rhodomicrobium udaipurense JA643]MBJ7544501.1 nucleotidyltransferase family protein [Rhodomicrobium udaipurense]